MKTYIFPSPPLLTPLPQVLIACRTLNTPPSLFCPTFKWQTFTHTHPCMYYVRHAHCTGKHRGIHLRFVETFLESHAKVQNVVVAGCE